MKCKRGDVVLLLFPDSNLRTAKRRPALVVQADGIATGLSQTIVAMVTSNLSRGGHPSRILIRLNSSQGRPTGLKADSIVMADNLATVLEGEIDKVIGLFSPMDSIDDALRHTLGL